MAAAFFRLFEDATAIAAAKIRVLAIIKKFIYNSFMPKEGIPYLIIYSVVKKHLR
jgi:hypothetical protein